MGENTPILQEMLRYPVCFNCKMTSISLAVFL